MLSVLCQQYIALNLLCAINSVTYRSEEFDLIYCCLRVVLRTLHDFHCNKPLHPETTEQVTFPNRKQQSQSQLLLYPAFKKQNCAVRMCSELFFVLDIPGKPHSREVSPAQLPDYVVFSIIEVSYFHMVIAT